MELAPIVTSLLDYTRTIDADASAGEVWSMCEGASRCLLLLSQLFGPACYQRIFGAEKVSERQRVRVGVRDKGSAAM